MLKTNWTLSTCGDGYWSEVRKTVRVTKLSVPYVSEDGEFGELRVYFDRDTWNTQQDGLIYTDSLFLDQLKEHLFLAGLDTQRVDYSEQGMQGTNYVSLDVWGDFLRGWEARMPVAA